MRMKLEQMKLQEQVQVGTLSSKLEISSFTQKQMCFSLLYQGESKVLQYFGSVKLNLAAPEAFVEVI